MSEKSASGRFALLDRDGTIMVDKAYLSDQDGIEFTPGAIEGLFLEAARRACAILAVGSGGDAACT
jgi:histidinol phosphatase-like enzyme